MTNKPARVMAEIGCNHKGDMAIAEELVRMAKVCGADVVKFQKRCVKQLLSQDEYSRPHPNPQHAYGSTYGEHREFLEFTAEQHAHLRDYCRQVGIGYSTSVWDTVSAREIVALEPALIKVPSASNTDFDMLKVLRDDYAGEVHISLGMTTRGEENDLIGFFEEAKAARKRLVIYACTSGYPVPFEDVCLLELTRLRESYQQRVMAIGFSGHHLGIAIDTAAFVLGAEWIERHFTLDRTWKGTDHAASLEPDGLRRVCRDVKAVAKALTYKGSDVLPIEQVQRAKLKRKVLA
ncbi:MAG: N-acetylneuraminate synthase family protein [Planctomycetes bacterium]|nr:N-acetylneuraminate synthase family protein [Planctomycetota bacterium]